MSADPRRLLQTIQGLEDELLDHIHDADEDYIQNMLASKVPSADAISAFLKRSRLYDIAKKRWSRIPNVAKEEKHLHYPFLKIFENVISHFGYSDCRHVQSLRPEMVWLERASRIDYYYSFVMPLGPNLFVSGSGSNFGPPRHPVKDLSEAKELDYQFCTSPCVVRMANEESDHRENKVVIDLAMYAKQCFLTQGNRHFVYSLSMTETHAQLFRFDRGGALRTVEIDIHHNALDFVRCVLLVCSPDNAVLGFDTSVFWEGDQRYISTVDAEGAPIRYSLVDPNPVFCHKRIRSRGTVCWAAVSDDGTSLLIKDAWRSKDHQAEWKMLLEAKGLDGVVQMVSYEEGSLLSEMRGRAFPVRPLGSWSQDRIRSRVTLVAYGTSICNFETREQFLYAFRDAVAGHRNLWNRNILHRDISPNNILLGRKDAQPGRRGIVIDMDMGIKLERDAILPRANYRIGTMLCQSINVLNNANDDDEYKSPSHDHLDDLESFFYVLCWTCFSYERPHKWAAASVLKQWENPTSRRAYADKFCFQSTSVIWKKKVKPYFGDIFKKLMLDLLRVLDIRRRFNDYWEKKTFLLTPLVDIVDSSQRDYERFLGCVDEAITSLEKENVERDNADRAKEKADKENVDKESAVQAPVRAPSPLAPAQLNVPCPQTNLKRGAEHLEEGEENAKATKIVRKDHDSWTAKHVNNSM